ncbi:MAG: hypothetical protein ACKO3W_11700 [bacterium]
MSGASTTNVGGKVPTSSSRRWVARNWLVLAIAVGALLSAGIGFMVGERRFTADRATTEESIDTYVSVLTQARKVRDGRSALDGRVQSVADRTLGPSLEVVDSEVRRRLNRACEELGITEFSVTTGTSIAKATPAKREFKQTNERALRDEPDFVEVEATVIAAGRAGQMYRLMHRVQVEPWLKRLESIRLDPSADGAQVRMTLKLRTIFLPGRPAAKPLVMDPQALATSERFAGLFAANPFRIPPPPVASMPQTVQTTASAGGSAGSQGGSPEAGVATPDVPSPASPFPYGEWQITGVVDGPSGAEVWLRHLPTGSQLTLQPGAAVGELIFRRVEYDFGVFDSPGGTCRVQVGSNLTQRSAAAG